MSELTLDQLAAGIQAQFGAISDDISLLRAQVKQVRDTFLRSTLTDVETTVNTIDTTTGTINTTTGTINTTTGTINTTSTAVKNGLGTLIPDVICAASSNSIGPLLAALGVSLPVSSAWPTANLALYIPFTVTIPVTAYKLWLMNGSVASGNFDIGIYSEAGARLTSTGSTAQSGALVQTVDIVDYEIATGRYYLALALDNTTGTVYTWTTANLSNFARMLGMKQQTSAFALPATLTAATPTNFPVMFGAAIRSDF